MAVIHARLLIDFKVIPFKSEHRNMATPGPVIGQRSINTFVSNEN